MTMTTTGSRAQLDEFNALSPKDVRVALSACLAVPRWVDTVADGRPYAGWSALRSAAADASADLTDDELESALARHPRIGEGAGADHDAEHSRREQAGVDPADRNVAARLAAGNTAYEERFDRVFLIRAAGRSADEILAELDRRLLNSVAEERMETISQLREIALLRLESVV